jgi:uncharacterized membrane protein YfcA
VVLGSLLDHRVPERMLRFGLALVLFTVGVKLLL